MHVQSLAWRPRFVSQQLEVGNAREKFGERNLCLQSRQRRAEAEVNALPEGDMRVWITRDIEAIGILERLWIAIGGANHCQHNLSGRDFLAVHLHFARWHAKHPLQR